MGFWMSNGLHCSHLYESDVLNPRWVGAHGLTLYLMGSVNGAQHVEAWCAYAAGAVSPTQPLCSPRHDLQPVRTKKLQGLPRGVSDKRE